MLIAFGQGPSFDDVNGLSLGDQVNVPGAVPCTLHPRRLLLDSTIRSCQGELRVTT